MKTHKNRFRPFSVFVGVFVMIYLIGLFGGEKLETRLISMITIFSIPNGKTSNNEEGLSSKYNLSEEGFAAPYVLDSIENTDSSLGTYQKRSDRKFVPNSLMENDSSADNQRIQQTIPNTRIMIRDSAFFNFIGAQLTPLIPEIERMFKIDTTRNGLNVIPSDHMI